MGLTKTIQEAGTSLLKRVFLQGTVHLPGNLECAPGGGAYGVVQDEALANIDDFCGSLDGQMIHQGERKDLKYFSKSWGNAEHNQCRLGK